MTAFDHIGQPTVAPTPTKKLVVIGIDHDVDKHGVTVYMEETDTWTSSSRTTFNLVGYIEAFCDRGYEVVVKMEGSWLVDKFYSYQRKKKVTVGSAMKIGMNVAQNHAVGQFLFETLQKELGKRALIETIAPIQKKIFKPDGKWNANTRNYFKQAYPDSTATNDDERDSELIARHVLTNILLDRRSRSYKQKNQPNNY